jgi:hypothetical protein
MRGKDESEPVEEAGPQTHESMTQSGQSAALDIPRISEKVRRRALEAIPRLRAHSDEILARRGGKPIDVDAALRAARAAHLHDNWVTNMTIKSRMKPTLESDLEIKPISERARRRVLEGLARLDALQERILARRGGKPIPQEVVDAALREARAAHERGE